ncbi:hypothetical protein ACQP3J_31515, partial [Escherichia coli]
VVFCPYICVTRVSLVALEVIGSPDTGVSASFGHISMNDIAVSWGKLIPNFLRNHHTDFQICCMEADSVTLSQALE